MSNSSDILGVRFVVRSEDSVYVDRATSGSGSFVPVSTNSVDVILTYSDCQPGFSTCVSNCEVTYTDLNAEYHPTNQISHLHYPGTSQAPGTYQWDEKGCLIEDNADDIEYYFDAFNRLDSVVVDNVKRFEFKYDAGGRRVKKIFYTGIACDSAETCETGHNDTCQYTGDCMFVPGDVNGNGYCQGSDLTFLVNYLRGGQAPPYPIFRADVNCDSYINGTDVTYLSNYLRGLPGFQPKCCYWLCTDTLVTYYVYSGNQVIAEYDGDGNLIDNYLYFGRNRLAKFKTGLTFKHYYINDIRGSTAAILTTSGDISAMLDYYPFGSVMTETGDSRYKYTGKELDDGYEFDLYYYGARYYDSEWGRFISPDPAREYYSPYSYVRNDPVNYVDPSGRWLFPVVCFVVAATIFTAEHELEIHMLIELASHPGETWNGITEMGQGAWDLGRRAWEGIDQPGVPGAPAPGGCPDCPW